MVVVGVGAVVVDIVRVGGVSVGGGGCVVCVFVFVVVVQP